MGTHLLECAGNNNPANFGLMSVAAWDGVPLVDRSPVCGRHAAATAVLVSGVDDEGQRPATSVGGRELGPAARGARSPRRLSRAADEW